MYVYGWPLIIQATTLAFNIALTKFRLHSSLLKIDYLTYFVMYFVLLIIFAW